MRLGAVHAERLGERASVAWVRREHDARFLFASRHVADQVVIDCACGTGIGSSRFISAGARRVLAFDTSERAAKSAAETGAEIVIATTTALPVGASCADVFISLETIEHIADDRLFLDEVVRVLRDDGIFICSTPNRQVKNPGLRRGEKPINPFHVREYDEEEFRDLLASRFGVVEVLGQNPVPRALVNAAGALAALLPGWVSARAQQAAKVRYLLQPFWRQHEVQRMRNGRAYEFFVAVCSAPMPRVR